MPLTPSEVAVELLSKGPDFLNEVMADIEAIKADKADGSFSYKTVADLVSSILEKAAVIADDLVREAKD